ncbi:MAG: RnfABCDGE type electron transport complex subunit B [Gammaproteobacteria bacterium]|nr:RnfABCDGE type electron transport complex subunit B [Gammaproteobacteria bacterium]
MKKTVTPDEIDAVLPQTQCGLCSYDGCHPYAEAIAHHHESLTLCPPGGVRGMKKLGQLMQQDVTPFMDSMHLKQKPIMLAKIREHDCIGCTKCIQACPVDAIIGTAKHMHTVIESECTGCELCVKPCPVDCIDMIEYCPVDYTSDEHTDTCHTARSNLYRERYRARNKRLAKEAQKKQERYAKMKAGLLKKFHHE